MNTPEQLKASLSKLLDVEIDCASSLLVSLKSESTNLASSEPGLVNVSNQAKIVLIDALQQATKARVDFSTYMRKQIVPKTDTRFGETQASENDTVLNARFSHLAKLAQDCYDENQLIGQLINRRTQFITQILDSLSPTSGNPLAVTYRENGDMSRESGKAHLDLAQI